tara:strand:- start:575 stop:760 length:186 start_codon:yes stop_codon:yes gene_type:complete
MTKKENKSIKEELKSLLNDAKDKVNEQVYDYSKQEMIKDIKKTATITTTAFATMVTCLWIS